MHVYSPCSISEVDKEDQMLEIYDRVILWADVIVIATPIRWGSASSLYYQMIQRMNCVQNQSITHGNYLIRDKVAAFIITGGQDNVQHVAGELMSFWSQLGFIFGKFPFVGWSRGWYAEDTENNYANMVGEGIDDGKPKSSILMHEDIMRTLRGAVEMSRLVSSNRYDESSKYSKPKSLIMFIPEENGGYSALSPPKQSQTYPSSNKTAIIPLTFL